jgi:glutamate racemase
VRAELLGGGGIAPRAGMGAGRHRFLSSGDIDTFRRLGARLLGPELDRVEPTPWS